MEMAGRMREYKESWSTEEYRHDHMERSRLSNDDIARFIIQRLCKTNGKESLKNIVSKNYQQLEIASIQTTTQLRDFIQQYSFCFILRSQSDDDDEFESGTARSGRGNSLREKKATSHDADVSSESLEVEVTTNLKICEKHSRDSGSCPGGRDCGGLHVCRFFILSGKCTFGNGCKFGHSLWNGHNHQVLQRHLMDHLHVRDLRVLFCRRNARTSSTRPVLCRFYNSSGCKKGQNCTALHMCKSFLFGDCGLGDSCPRSHDYNDPVVAQILSQFGVDIEDLAELMWDNIQNPPTTRQPTSRSRSFTRISKRDRGKNSFVKSRGGKSPSSAGRSVPLEKQDMGREDKSANPINNGHFDGMEAENANPGTGNVDTILANLLSRVQQLHSRVADSPQVPVCPSPSPHRDTDGNQLEAAERTHEEDTERIPGEDGEILQSEGEISDSEEEEEEDDDTTSGRKREWRQDQSHGRLCPAVKESERARVEEEITVMVDRLRSESNHSFGPEEHPDHEKPPHFAAVTMDHYDQQYQHRTHTDGNKDLDMDRGYDRSSQQTNQTLSRGRDEFTEIKDRQTMEMFSSDERSMDEMSAQRTSHGKKDDWISSHRDDNVWNSSFSNDTSFARNGSFESDRNLYSNGYKRETVGQRSLDLSDISPQETYPLDQSPRSKNVTDHHNHPHTPPHTSSENQDYGSHNGRQGNSRREDVRHDEFKENRKADGLEDVSCDELDEAHKTRPRWNWRSPSQRGRPLWNRSQHPGKRARNRHWKESEYLNGQRKETDRSRSRDHSSRVTDRQFPQQHKQRARDDGPRRLDERFTRGVRGRDPYDDYRTDDVRTGRSRYDQFERRQELPSPGTEFWRRNKSLDRKSQDLIADGGRQDYHYSDRRESSHTGRSETSDNQERRRGRSRDRNSKAGSHSGIERSKEDKYRVRDGSEEGRDWRRRSSPASRSGSSMGTRDRRHHGNGSLEQENGDRSKPFNDWQVAHRRNDISLEAQGESHYQPDSKETWDNGNSFSDRDSRFSRSSRDRFTGKYQCAEDGFVGNHYAQVEPSANVIMDNNSDSQTWWKGEELAAAKGIQGSLKKFAGYRQWKRYQGENQASTKDYDGRDLSPFRPDGNGQTEFLHASDGHEQVSSDEGLQTNGCRLEPEYRSHDRGDDLTTTCACGARSKGTCFRCAKQCENYREWRELYGERTPSESSRGETIQHRSTPHVKEDFHGDYSSHPDAFSKNGYRHNTRNNQNVDYHRERRGRGQRPRGGAKISWHGADRQERHAANHDADEFMERSRFPECITPIMTSSPKKGHEFDDSFNQTDNFGYNDIRHDFGHVDQKCSSNDREPQPTHRDETDISRHGYNRRQRFRSGSIDLSHISDYRDLGSHDLDPMSSGLQHIDNLHASVNELLGQFRRSRSRSPTWTPGSPDKKRGSNYKPKLGARSTSSERYRWTRKRKSDTKERSSFEEGYKSRKVSRYFQTADSVRNGGFRQTLGEFSNVDVDEERRETKDRSGRNGFSNQKDYIFTDTGEQHVQSRELRNLNSSMTSDSVQVFYSSGDSFMEDPDNYYRRETGLEESFYRQANQARERSLGYLDACSDENGERYVQDYIPEPAEDEPERKISTADLRHRLKHKDTDDNDLRKRLRDKKAERIKQKINAEPIQIQVNTGSGVKPQQRRSRIPSDNSGREVTVLKKNLE